MIFVHQFQAIYPQYAGAVTEVLPKHGGFNTNSPTLLSNYFLSSQRGVHAAGMETISSNARHTHHHQRSHLCRRHMMLSLRGTPFSKYKTSGRDRGGLGLSSPKGPFPTTPERCRGDKASSTVPPMGSTSVGWLESDSWI